MNYLPSISVAIPYHGDRSKWTLQTIRNVHNLNFVKEIVLTIEPGSDEKPLRVLAKYKKVRIFHNLKNLFVFHNKLHAVMECNGEWVALIDSDNVIGAQYFGPFFSDKNRHEKVIYSPSIGYPKLRYEEFISEDINLRRSAELLDNPRFNMLLNTMNYIFHRETWWNAVYDAMNSDYDPMTADSLWINYNCMKAGMVLRVVYGMTYKHTIHDQSTYKLYANDGVRESEKIKAMIREHYANSAGSRSIPSKRQDALSAASAGFAVGGPLRGVGEDESNSDRSALLTD